MDIISFVEEWFVKMRETNAVILEVYKTGSQLFRDDPHDLDFEVICENLDQRFVFKQTKENGICYDIVIIDKRALEAQLDFNNKYYTERRLKFFNYLFAIRETIYGDANITWNMLEYKKAYLTYLSERFEEDSTRSGMRGSYRRGKFYVHYYIPLKIYENNSLEITTEMSAGIKVLYAGGEEAIPVIEWVTAEIEKLGGE